MPHDELRNAAHAIVARLQADFDAHLQRIEEHHAEAREETRREVEARAAAEWTAKLEAERGDWQRRFDAAMAEAHAAAERATSTLAEAHAEMERRARALADAQAEGQRTSQALADLRADAERTSHALSEARAEAERNASALADSRAESERNATALAEARAAIDRNAGELAESRADAERTANALAEARAEAERNGKAAAEARGEIDRSAAAVAEAQAEAERRAMAQAEADRRAAAAVAELEGESARRAAAVAEAKAEVERTLGAERDRAGDELSTERTRMLGELSAHRDRAAAEIELERRKAQTLATTIEELRAALTVAETESRTARSVQEELRATLTEERDGARAAAAARQQAPDEAAMINARAAERQAQLAFVERLLTAVRTIGKARSLSDTLTALTSAAATLAPRVALFIVNDRPDAPGRRELQGWRASGFGDRSPASLKLSNDDGGVIAAAAALSRPISTANSPAPDFAELPRDRAAMGVPIVVGGKSVAVLYADDGSPQESEAPASWPEAMQILGVHASAWLTQITAVRTTQAMRATTGRLRGAAGGADDESSARRYARLLVSEIKLYNEAAVRSGREKRDLLQRLRPEIERARRLFEERVPPSGARATYFQDELVHTLADGDATLLGSA